MVGSGQRIFSQMPIIHYFCEIPASSTVKSLQPHLLAGQNPAEGHACPPQDDMVKGTGRVDSGVAGRDGCLLLYPIIINLSPSCRPLALSFNAIHTVSLFIAALLLPCRQSEGDGQGAIRMRRKGQSEERIDAGGDGMDWRPGASLR